jgi:hypothetical protein
MSKSRYRGVPLKVRQAVWERADGICEGEYHRIGKGLTRTVERVGDCGGVAEQLCHKEHRGIGGSRLRDGEDNLLALCAYHHDLLDGRER